MLPRTTPRSTRSDVRAPSLWLSLGCVLLLASVGPARGARWTVLPDGSGDYPTIQDAVNQVADGDTVELGDGVFGGNGNRNIAFMGRPITVRSASGQPEACIIDCGGGPGNERRGFLFTDYEERTSVLEGVTIRHAYLSGVTYPAGNGGGIFCEHASPVIRRCIFTENTAQDGAGVFTAWGDVLVESCIFRDNTSLRLAGGLATLQGKLTIERCVFTGNVAAGGGALGLDVGSEVQVLDCTISGNSAQLYGGGIMLGGCDSRLERTVLWGNCAGYQGDEAWMGGVSGPTILRVRCTVVNSTAIYRGGCTLIWEDDPIEEDPLFCDPQSCEMAPTPEGDYSVDFASPCLPGANPCGVLIGALEAGCGSPAATPQDMSGGSEVDLRLQGAQPVTSRLACELRLPAEGFVALRICDVRGRLLETLYTGRLSAGTHDFAWKVPPAWGRGCAFLLAETAHGRTARKIILVN